MNVKCRKPWSLMIRKSQASGGQTRVNNSTLISLSRFSMKHVPLTNTQNFPEKSWQWNVPILIKRNILRRHRNLIKSVTDVIFFWHLNGTHVFCINSLTFWIPSVRPFWHSVIDCHLQTPFIRFNDSINFTRVTLQILLNWNNNIFDWEKSGFF